MATFLVVFAHMYHSDSQERLYIYAFHMPFFFFVSGLFFKPVPIIAEIKRSLKKLIIPAFIFIVLSIIIHVLFFNCSLTKQIHGSVLGLLSGKQITANNIAWFFFALANVRIIANIWYHKKFLCCILLLVIIVITWKIQTPFLFLIQSIGALPFYLFAFYSRDLITKEASKDRGWARIVISIFLFITTISLSTLNGHTGVLGLMMGDLPLGINIIVFYVNAIIGSLLILNTALLFNKPCNLIKVTASALITIVGCQRIPVNMYIAYFGVNSPYYYSVPFSIIIMAICVLLHKPISKLFPK